MTNRAAKKRPMTPSQKKALAALCRKTGERVEENLSETQAECRIIVLSTLDTLPCH